MFLNLWKQFKNRPAAPVRRGKTPPVRPSVETLEGRWLPAPITNQVVPVAVYVDTTGAFGLAYDSTLNRIWYTQGDAGDDLIHSLRPFNTYTAAEIAAFPVVNGVPQISLVAGQHDVAGTTNPSSFGSIGAHFRALAYDATSNRLVLNTPSSTLHAFQAITGANLDTNFRPGTSPDDFADGFDTDGATTWFSPDADNIFKDGVLFGDKTNPAQTTLPGWTANGGLGGDDLAGGWSGTEQVGNRLFAVAVMDSADAGKSRTIVQFDTTTGELLFFDPDGDPVASRWEDLAFDGRYLYAADLRGNANQSGPSGDIYVFDISGPGGLVDDTGNQKPPPTETPAAEKVRLQFDLLDRNAGFHNGVGVIILDADFTIKGARVKPRNVLRKAMHAGRLFNLFDPDQEAPARKFLVVPADAKILMFIVQDSSVEKLLADNPQNLLSKHPLALFSLKRLNPDGKGHVRVKGNGVKFVSAEDRTVNSDQDFNDVIASYQVVPR